MKLLNKSNAPDAKLGIIERSAYMTGNIGTALVNTIVASFVVFYYTDIMMLNPAVIGTILLISRIFDGMTDLLMGFVVDHTRSRFGKGRAWVLRMCIPYAISAVLMMSVPANASETFKYIYIFLTYNLCNTVCLTAVYVPYNSMTCTLTNDPYERGVLGVFVMFGAVFGTMAVQSTIDAAVKALGNGPDAWQKVTIVYALIGACLHLICFFLTKERTLSDSADTVQKKQSVKEEIGAVLGNKYWLMAIAAVFATLFFTGMIGGSGMYFAKAVLGDTAHYASFANVMALTQVAAMLLAFIPMKKIGKRNTLVIGLSILAISCAVQYFFGSSLKATIGASVGKGIGGGFAGAVCYGLLADTIDYGEWKFGISASGIGMSAMTFVTKIAGGLSGFLIGHVINAGHYDAALSVQAESAITAIKLCFAAIPGVCCIVALAIMLFYDLDKIYPQIQKELAARRTSASAQ